MGAITEDNLKELLERVQTRIKPYNVVATEDNLKELITTIADRICLRVGDSVLSDLLYSIAVDATVKIWLEGLTTKVLILRVWILSPHHLSVMY